MNIRQKKGISLIVLVITIVVMVILAAVIILSLSGSGIIDNAKEARDKSNKSNLKEAAQVAYSEWSTSYALGKTKLSADDYVDKVLREADFSEDQIKRVDIEEGFVKIKEDITFTIEDEQGKKTQYTVLEGTTWGDFVKKNSHNIQERKSGFFIMNINTSNIVCYDEYFDSGRNDDCAILKEKLDVNGTGYTNNYEKLSKYPEAWCYENEIIKKDTTYFNCIVLNNY